MVLSSNKLFELIELKPVRLDIKKKKKCTRNQEFTVAVLICLLIFHIDHVSNPSEVGLSMSSWTVVIISALQSGQYCN